MESAAVCGNGFICCGNGIAGGTSCSVCVEIESESIRGVGHLILHSCCDSLLRGVDGFCLEILAWRGGLEGAGISGGDGGERIGVYGFDHTEN